MSLRLPKHAGGHTAFFDEWLARRLLAYLHDGLTAGP